MTKKSYWPVYQSLNTIGDKWSLIIIRDIIYHRKRHFNDFLSSKEKIAKSTHSNRLKKLMENGIIMKVPDASHKQKNKYVLTLKGIELVRAFIDDKKSFINISKKYLIEEAEKVFEENPELLIQH